MTLHRAFRPRSEDLEARRLLTVLVAAFDTGATPDATTAGHLIPVPITFLDNSAGAPVVSGHGTVMADEVTRQLTAAGLSDFAVLELKCDDPTGNINDAAVLNAAAWLLAFQAANPQDPIVAEWSFGGPAADPLLNSVVDRLGRAGIPIAAAAGNTGTSNDARPMYPANIAAPNLVSVADTGPDNALESFSNYGPGTVPLAAQAGRLGTSGAAAVAAAWMAVEEASRPLTPGDDPRAYAQAVVAALDGAAVRDPALAGLVATGGQLVGAPRAVPLVVTGPAVRDPAPSGLVAADGPLVGAPPARPVVVPDTVPTPSKPHPVTVHVLPRPHSHPVVHPRRHRG